MAKHVRGAAMMWATAIAQTVDKEIIKWGTLATEASDWGQVLKQMNAGLVKQSSGKLVIRFYFGRDEQDLVSARYFHSVKQLKKPSSERSLL